MAWDSGTYRRDASKANRGKPFEDFINFANEKYQAKGIAVMHKVPTEFIPLRGAHGQVANCKHNAPVRHGSEHDGRTVKVGNAEPRRILAETVRTAEKRVRS